jgi:hypothetical protein
VRVCEFRVKFAMQIAICTFRSARQVAVNVSKALPQLFRVLLVSCCNFGELSDRQRTQLYALWLLFMSLCGMVFFQHLNEQASTSMVRENFGC